MISIPPLVCQFGYAFGNAKDILNLIARKSIPFGGIIQYDVVESFESAL